jgi:hypothetical protein
MIVARHACCHRPGRAPLGDRGGAVASHARYIGAMAASTAGAIACLSSRARVWSAAPRT